MGPVADARDETVLHWIEMNVIDMPLEISLVADGVFPEAALPESVLSIAVPRDGSAGPHHRRRKSSFDETQPI